MAEKECKNARKMTNDIETKQNKTNSNLTWKENFCSVYFLIYLSVDCLANIYTVYIYIYEINLINKHIV